jgi:hypothetical protein
MWISCHLLKKQLISADQLAAAVQRQIQSRPSIGRLALESRKLSMRQVKEILLVQAVDPKPFGEIAREMGFLSIEGLALLLFRQEELSQSLSEILIESGAIDRTRLQQELQDAYHTLNDNSSLSAPASV